MIGSRIVIAAAEGIVIAHDRTLLVERGGHIHLTRDWKLSLLSHMGFVKRKANTKAKAQVTQQQFQQMKLTYSSRWYQWYNATEFHPALSLT